MQENINSLTEILKVQKNLRAKAVQKLPIQLRWLSMCKKTQIPYVILKFLLDDDSQKIYNWPAYDEKCDFCIVGSVANAQIKLHDFCERFDINVFAWWKRYVRQIFCSKKESGENLVQCNLINKPIFFTQDDKKIENEQIFMEKEKDCYRCSVCLLPKRGHTCVKKITTKSCKTESNEIDEKVIGNEEIFEDIFVEETTAKKNNKRLFPMNVSTSTATTREMMPTDFSFCDD